MSIVQEKPGFHTWEASPRVACPEGFIFRLSEAFTEVSFYLRPGMLDWKFFTYHAEENWGALQHKFLPITCGRRLSFLHPDLHTNMQTEIYTHAHNILWLIICMRKFVWLSSLSISHSDFILDDNIFQASCIAEPNFCIWSIPLTGNIPLILSPTCLVADLIITPGRILY